MEHIKKNFGFGFLRLPMKDGEIDLAETSKMVDAFLDAGFNYFDTAYGYLQGKSETALKVCLTSRYPRSSYVLTDKLTARTWQRSLRRNNLGRFHAEAFDKKAVKPRRWSFTVFGCTGGLSRASRRRGWRRSA